MKHCWWILGGWLLLSAAPLQALSPPEEMGRALRLFEAGKYQAAIRKWEGLLNNLSLVDPVEIARTHMYLGISYFTIDERRSAEEHFQDLLNFNPQAELDPLYSSPKTRAFFERIKKDRLAELQKRRQEMEEQLKNRRSAPPSPPPAPPAVPPAVSTVPLLAAPAAPFPYYYNFVPFGMGQFKNGKTGKGIFFLSLEGVTLATALTALALFELEKNGQGGFKSPSDADLYRDLFLGTFFTFVGSAAFGAIDSLFDYHEAKRKLALAGWSLACLPEGGLGVRHAF